MLWLIKRKNNKANGEKQRYKMVGVGGIQVNFKPVVGGWGLKQHRWEDLNYRVRREWTTKTKQGKGRVEKRGLVIGKQTLSKKTWAWPWEAWCWNKGRKLGIISYVIGELGTWKGEKKRWGRRDGIEPNGKAKGGCGRTIFSRTVLDGNKWERKAKRLEIWGGGGRNYFPDGGPSTR